MNIWTRTWCFIQAYGSKFIFGTALIPIILLLIAIVVNYSIIPVENAFDPSINGLKYFASLIEKSSVILSAFAIYSAGFVAIVHLNIIRKSESGKRRVALMTLHLPIIKDYFSTIGRSFNEYFYEHIKGNLHSDLSWAVNNKMVVRRRSDIESFFHHLPEQFVFALESYHNYNAMGLGWSRGKMSAVQLFEKYFLLLFEFDRYPNGKNELFRIYQEYWLRDVFTKACIHTQVPPIQEIVKNGQAVIHLDTLCHVYVGFPVPVKASNKLFFIVWESKAGMFHKNIYLAIIKEEAEAFFAKEKKYKQVNGIIEHWTNNINILICYFSYE